MLLINKYIGKPFRNGGRGPDVFDCYGLVKAIYSELLRIELRDFEVSAFDPKKVSQIIENESPRWKQVTIPVEGSVIVIRNHPRIPQACNHCGVFVGQGKFIHALFSKGVILSRLNDPIWKNKIEGFYNWVRQ